MILWVRTRRVGGLVLGLVGLGGLAVVLGPRSLAVPALFGSAASTVLLAAILPLLWAAVLADAFAARTQAVEVRPCLRLRLLDVGLFLVAAAVAAAVLQETLAAAGSYGALGPVLIVSGLACCATLWRGAGPAVFVVTALLLGTTAYGVDAPAARYIRVLQVDGVAWWSFSCGAVLCLLACTALLKRRVGSQLGATHRLE